LIGEAALPATRQFSAGCSAWPVVGRVFRWFGDFGWLCRGVAGRAATFGGLVARAAWLIAMPAAANLRGHRGSPGLARWLAAIEPGQVPRCAA
jgi:hypothetical protein